MIDITPQFQLYPLEQEIVIDPSLSSEAAPVVGGFQAGPNELKQGNITIQGLQERILIGAASASMTGTGVFIGNAGDGTYDFRAGDPSGQYIQYDGSTGILTVSGTITASAIDIGGSDATSFHVDVDGNMWLGASTFAGAPAKVSNAGAATFSSITLSGSVAISGIANNSSTDISLLEKTHDLVFSVTDADTIAWALGTITLSNGRTFSIAAGNTGNMAALTYIYLDPAVSTTALQTTTTASTALGANKILIGVAQNNTVTASYIPYGPGRALVDGAQIGALSIVAGNIAASTITAAKLTVSQLSAIAADLGTVTAGAISGVTIAIGSANNIFKADSNGIYLGNATFASAPFRVTPAGAVTATSITLSGSVAISGIANNTSTDISLLECSHSIVFSSTDLNTISWASGTINLSNGRTFSISSGNTGNMAALTYIYLDPGVSSVALQTTTTFSTAIGANKMLIGTAQNQTVAASFIPFQAGHPVISGDQLQALSIQTASIAALAVTNAKINDLAVSKLTAGTISSQSIVLAVTNGTGDVEIRSGIATGDFDNAGAASGFIIGVDDSDSDRAKFYFGGPNGYVKFDGVTFSILGVSNNKKNYVAAEAITAGQAVAVGLYTSGGGISYDSYTTGSGSANGQGSFTFTNAITVGSNSNRVLVFVTTNGSSNGTWSAINTSATVTFNGTSMTALGGSSAVSDSGNRTSIGVWILAAPSTGAHDIVYGGSYGGNGLNAIGYSWYAFSVYNCKQTSIPHDSAIDSQQRGNAGAGNNINITSTSTVDGCLTIIAGGDQTRFHDTGSYGGDSGIMIPKGDYSLSSVNGNGGAQSAALITLEPATAPSAAVVIASAKTRNVTDYWATTNYKSVSFLGFADASISAGASGAVVIAGEATGLSSLTLGTQYYLSDTYGAISSSVGTNTRKVAIATSTTTALVTNIW